MKEVNDDHQDQDQDDHQGQDGDHQDQDDDQCIFSVSCEGDYMYWIWLLSADGLFIELELWRLKMWPWRSFQSCF